jgi:hypothetical protein
MWHRHRVRTARGAETFADAMFDLGYTTYSGTCPVIPDGCKFYGFTWGTSQDEEKRKIIIFTPSREVYASWTRAKELSE